MVEWKFGSHPAFHFIHVTEIGTSKIALIHTPPIVNPMRNQADTIIGTTGKRFTEHCAVQALGFALKQALRNLSHEIESLGTLQSCEIGVNCPQKLAHQSCVIYQAGNDGETGDC